MDTLLIQLQSSVGDFDESFIKELRRFEPIMEARGLDPTSYVISKDRVQFTELPIFVRPGGNGYNYTVFVADESFTVTKPNDMAFLGYFEQLCAAAMMDEMEATTPSLWEKVCAPFKRIKAWFDAPLFDASARSE